MDKRTVDLEGAAHVHVVPGATLLHPEETVFNAMVDGWSAQMRSRLLSMTASIEPRIRMVRRFSEFTNDYPWNWVPQDLEERTKSLLSGAKTIAHSTVRGYQNAVAMFSITSPTPLRLGGGVREPLSNPPRSDLPRVEHRHPRQRLRGRSRRTPVYKRGAAELFRPRLWGQADLDGCTGATTRDAAPPRFSPCRLHP